MLLSCFWLMVQCLLIEIEIRFHIVRYHGHLFFEQFAWRPKPDILAVESIKEGMVGWLERPFTWYFLSVH